jgi:hypothetical protein
MDKVALLEFETSIIETHNGVHQPLEWSAAKRESTASIESARSIVENIDDFQFFFVELVDARCLN